MWDACPCGCAVPLPLCCGLFLWGGMVPETAEQLMRSRYTAFARGDGPYLVRTGYHAESAEELSAFGRAAAWRGLFIYQTRAGQREDAEGEVSFLVHLETAGKALVLHERSSFIRDARGAWYYALGRPGTLPSKASCPCGSGQMFKRCCSDRVTLL